MTEAREEEERRVIRLEMRRASIAREEAKKAAIRATEEAEKAAQVPQNQPPTTPPLPAEGLPEGWTMEQWKWYGAEWLSKQGK